MFTPDDAKLMLHEVEELWDKLDDRMSEIWNYLEDNPDPVLKYLDMLGKDDTFNLCRRMGLQDVEIGYNSDYYKIQNIMDEMSNLVCYSNFQLDHWRKVFLELGIVERGSAYIPLYSEKAPYYLHPNPPPDLRNLSVVEYYIEEMMKHKEFEGMEHQIRADLFPWLRWVCKTGMPLSIYIEGMRKRLAPIHDKLHKAGLIRF